MFLRKLTQHSPLFSFFIFQKDEGGCFSLSGCFDRFIRKLEWGDKTNEVGLILHVSGSERTESSFKKAVLADRSSSV